ncbi:hypothetical protein FRC00_003175 [Tulasnella sp. 408]|nr:hypothetical protein FRC00_003175 [Tulasnella sp. 408]
MLLEHIAIAKSSGCLNGSKINPNHELIAIGVTNCIDTLFNATGSFSRTAVKSKSGVRTPIADQPSHELIAIGVTNCMDTLFNAAGSFSRAPVPSLLVTVFSSIDNGIYTSICASAVLLIIRIARPYGHFALLLLVSMVSYLVYNKISYMWLS